MTNRNEGKSNNSESPANGAPVVSDKPPTALLSGGRTTQPLAAPLAQHFNIAIYDQNSLGHFLTKLETVMCPIQGAGDPLKTAATNDAALLAGRLAAKMPRLPQRFFIPGFNPEGLQMKGLRKWLPGTAMTLISGLSLDLRALDAFADQVDLRVVVTHEDVTPRNRAMVLWARAKGIPTIHIPHANHYCHVRPDIHDEGLCDWLLATSPWMRDWYVERGYPAERVVVTGCPNWDSWGKVRKHMPRDNARTVLMLDQEAPTVVYFTSWSQNTNIIDDHTVKPQTDAAMLEAAKAEGWQLVIKMHPGEPEQWIQHYANLAKERGVPAVISRRHLEYCLRAADVAVAIGPSNVLVEAALAERPGVVVPLRGYDFGGEPPWRAEPTADDIRRVVGQVLARPDAWEAARPDFIARHAYSDDCGATARAAAAVLEVANGAENLSENAK